jgi:hypothetical protein
MSTPITFVNRDWASVSFQVRIGNNANPEQNPLSGQPTLQQGQTWSTASSGENVWYRREANPIAHDGNWQNWTNQAVFDDSDPITITFG